jgi:hypothetical protein
MRIVATFYSNLRLYCGKNMYQAVAGRSGQTLTATTIFTILINVKSFMRYKPDDSPRLEKAGRLSVLWAPARNLFMLEIFA